MGQEAHGRSLSLTHILYVCKVMQELTHFLEPALIHVHEHMYVATYA